MRDRTMPVADAVASYLFNSQLLTRADGNMLLIVPEECRKNERVWNYLSRLTAEDGPIREVKVFDLKQSMQNGGGPACLRLRVALKEHEGGGQSGRGDDPRAVHHPQCLGRQALP